MMRIIKCPFKDCSFSQRMGDEESPLMSRILRPFVEHFLQKHSPSQISNLLAHLLGEEWLRKETQKVE